MKQSYNQALFKDDANDDILVDMVGLGRCYEVVNKRDNTGLCR